MEMYRMYGLDAMGAGGIYPSFSPSNKTLEHECSVVEAALQGIGNRPELVDLTRERLAEFGDEGVGQLARKLADRPAFQSEREVIERFSSARNLYNVRRAYDPDAYESPDIHGMVTSQQSSSLSLPILRVSNLKQALLAGLHALGQIGPWGSSPPGISGRARDHEVPLDYPSQDVRGAVARRVSSVPATPMANGVFAGGVYQPLVEATTKSTVASQVSALTNHMTVLAAAMARDPRCRGIATGTLGLALLAAGYGFYESFGADSPSTASRRDTLDNDIQQALSRIDSDGASLWDRARALTHESSSPEAALRELLQSSPGALEALGHLVEEGDGQAVQSAAHPAGGVAAAPSWFGDDVLLNSIVSHVKHAIRHYEEQAFLRTTALIAESSTPREGRREVIKAQLDEFRLPWKELPYRLDVNPKGAPPYILSEGVNLMVDLAPAEAGKLPILMLGAHYDRTNKGTGALDNGSGCAAALTLAARLRDHPLENHRVQVMFFDNGEAEADPYQYASRQYIWDCKRNKVCPDLYVNLDMVGAGEALFVSATDDGHRLFPQGTPVASNANEEALVAALHNTSMPVIRDGAALPGEDRSFRERGLPAVGVQLVHPEGPAQMRAANDAKQRFLETPSDEWQRREVLRGAYVEAKGKVDLLKIVHTEADTIDKVNGAQAIDGVNALEQAIRQWDKTPVSTTPRGNAE